MADIIRRNPNNSMSLPTFGRSPFGQLLRDLLSWDPLQDVAPAMRGEVNFAPAFEVKENKEEFVIKADLPGVKDEDVQISASGNRVTISGKREHDQREEGETYYFAETEYGMFSRTFTLPDPVDVESAKADLKNGQLILRIPKRPEMQQKQIMIKGDSGSSSKVGGEKRPPQQNQPRS